MSKLTVNNVVVGLDLGDRFSWLCVLDGDGEVVEEGRIQSTEAALRRWFGPRESACVAIEVGTHSPWISRLLKELGHEVIVANARHVRMIYDGDRKSDRLDAEALARLARLDPALLHGIAHRSEEAHHDLAVIRAREVLVRTRTRLINHVRGAVKSAGHRVPRSSSAAFHRTAAEAIPTGLKEALEPLLDMLEQITQEIRAYDRRIETLASERYPETGALTQVTGVGTLTALAYVLTLEDPGRFATSRAVGPYLGLCPGKDQSGDRDVQCRMTKAGNEMLRRLLIQAAHYQLGPHGPDSDLRRWGSERGARGGRIAHKKAVGGVARKLAVLLHHLWTSGEVYQPLRNSGGGDEPTAQAA
ncbi:MAG TPA: IS110 family transposase [Candidatus Krumholzibacteria bacterium]|nr:IS110 family transposase [Candidatus Krumholzibacteria bacterium]